MPDEATDQRERVEQALVKLATELPPKERACLVLDDVLGWSLEETAEIVGSSVGAVKAALHRARARLAHAARGAEPRTARAIDPGRRALVARYLEAFNRQDWDAVRALVADDARLEVVHRVECPLRESSYFVNYASLSWRWKLALADVDGVESIVHFRELGGAWAPRSMVRLEVAGGAIVRVRDYVHVDYLLGCCTVGCTVRRDREP
jgi:RNA polymerase sigma-70 factor (ECF subfamily)